MIGLAYTTEASGMCLRILGATRPLGRLFPAFPHSALFLLFSRFGGFGRFRVALPAPMRIWACCTHFSGAHGMPVSDPAKLKRVRHGGSKISVLAARGKVPPPRPTDNPSPRSSLVLVSVGSAFCTLPLSPADASSPLVLAPLTSCP